MHWPDPQKISICSPSPVRMIVFPGRSGHGSGLRNATFRRSWSVVLPIFQVLAWAGSQFFWIAVLDSRVAVEVEDHQSIGGARFQSGSDDALEPGFFPNSLMSSRGSQLWFCQFETSGALPESPAPHGSSGRMPSSSYSSKMFSAQPRGLFGLTRDAPPQTATGAEDLPKVSTSELVSPRLNDHSDC